MPRPRPIKKYFFTQQQDHNKLETGVHALMVVRYWRKITVAVFIRQKPPVCTLITAVMHGPTEVIQSRHGVGRAKTALC
jgi:hypothetical protein